MGFHCLLRQANNKMGQPNSTPGQSLNIPGTASSTATNHQKPTVSKSVIPYTASDVDLWQD